MNILLVNWAWRPTGGDWIYIDNVRRLYEENNHRVIPFSMHHEQNYPTPYSRYFIEKIDYNELNAKKTWANGLTVLRKSIYSRESKRNLEMLLKEQAVDIAQLNNVHNYLTPSIIPILKKHRIPIVWRILDYKIICPNTTFIAGSEICEECKGGKFYHCIVKCCKKRSRLASAIAAAESYAHRFRRVYDHVNMFLFQSSFSRDKFIEHGFKNVPAEIVKNPFDSSSIIPCYQHENYILYFGRIEAIKGIFTLLDAMKFIPQIRLKVVGSGRDLQRAVDHVRNSRSENVVFEGAKWGKDLKPLIEACRFVVIPSEWYEVSPYAALEAFAYGKPVVASRIGGLPELVKDRKSGILFEPKNAHDLADAIQQLYNDAKRMEEYGRNAREQVESEHGCNVYYQTTIGIFNKIVTV